MDLIYADKSRRDVGVLLAYKLDMAYGSDEDDFTLTVDSKDHCCSEGYYVYAEGTEYGGIVDSIKVNQDSGQISYVGRSWHGILEGKVICPDAGQDYLILNGDANAVIAELLSRLDLTGLFAVTGTASGIMIYNHRIRYEPAYTGICKMLQEAEAKLTLRWSDGMVLLSAEPLDDYSQDEEISADQALFSLKKNYHPVNHLVCLGQGDLRDRAVIHLYTDEGGGIMPYTLTDQPIQDSDYILDSSQQIITGKDEVTEIYDADTAAITTNYVLTDAQPDDWEEAADTYYTREIDEDDGDEHYAKVRLVKRGYVLQMQQPYDWPTGFANYYTREIDEQGEDHYSAVRGEEGYTLLTVRPSDWAEAYDDYYIKVGTEYDRVDGIDKADYVRQTKQPADWLQHYDDYYYRYSDGTRVEYRRVQGVQHETYVKQTSCPTDWATSYSSYYRRSTKKERKQSKSQFHHVEATKKQNAPAWRAGKYFTRRTYETPPAWRAAVRYTCYKSKLPPTWAANRYYRKSNDFPPAWAADTYYTNSDEMIAPPWISATYYRAVYDRYAVLVEDGIERIREAWDSDELEIDLAETDQVYDVGDIVGARDEVTGIEVAQYVTKKIVKISNGDIDITYEVGKT